MTAAWVNSNSINLNLYNVLSQVGDIYFQGHDVELLELIYGIYILQKYPTSLISFQRLEQHDQKRSPEE